MADGGATSGEDEAAKDTRLFMSATLQRDNDELTKTNDELVLKNEALFKTMMDLQEQAWQSRDKKKMRTHRELQAENEKIQTTVEALQKQTDELNATIKDIEGHVYRSKNVNKKALAVMIKSLNTELESLQKENSEGLIINKNKQMDVKALREQTDEKLMKHKAEKEALKQQNETLQKEVLQLEESVQEVNFAQYTESAQEILISEKEGLKKDLQELKELLGKS